MRIILLLLLLVLAASLYAQSRRPKIGLVLSGGGAKGLAHVGVLKAMEKAGLTPDYITGTSMGSVVGGLYAMGYSAEDLEQIVNRIDWDDILTNKITLSEIVIEEKPYYNRYISEIPLTGPFKPSFPSGLIEGQKLEELLIDLTRPVHDIDNFSQLSIPFACVATDISTGRAVVLNNGSLAQCLRASMAIPGVFTPVEIDGRLLVDGGLVRNFPVQEVIDMGADIVIGVFVSDDLKKKEELGNFVAILFQTSWVMSAYDTREQKEMVDYYVEPVNTGYGTGDFKRAKEIIHQGELIGQEFLPSFKKLADSLNALGPGKQHVKPSRMDSYYINRVVITGSKKLPADVTRRKLAITEHTVVSSKEIEKRVTLLFGTQHFNSVGYHLNRVDSGYNLVINTRESAPGKLKGAFHYDTENKAGININYTLRNALFPNSRAIAEVDLAEYPRLDLNYLKYMGKHQNVAAMLRGDFNSILIRVNDGRVSGDYLAREYSFNGSVFTTTETNRSGGIDFSQRHITMKPEVGREFDYIRNNSFSSQTWFQVNSLERPFYPRRGEQLWTSLTGFFDTSVALKFSTDSMTLEDKWHVDNMLRADVGYLRLIPLGRNVVVVGEGRLAVSNLNERSNVSLIGNTFFGGFKPRARDSYAFYGANSYDYSALSYFLMKADVQVELRKRLYLTTGINFVTIKYPMFWLDEDYMRQGNLRDEKSWRLGYGASLGYLSLIGPISASVAIDQARAQLVGNFSLGFFF